ncbi:DUF2127 domain-containing protein [Catenulispora subtropica]|uniref:DUF2127 domain-containing protein n=1 Tax=Catenulispora subtropica TaxID=450798 RepID=A0ABN2T4R2_9ACTN
MNEKRHRFDWSLLGCALSGHVLYAPDEAALRGRLTARTPGGTTWRCLRCADFVPVPDGTKPPSGPARDAPLVKRGAEMRDAVLLRFFAVERWVRGALLLAAAYVVHRFEGRQDELRQAFDQAAPVVKQVFGKAGFDLQHSKTLELLQKAVDAKPTTLTWIVTALIAYAAVEVVEGVGLWLLKRWGEYFAFVATGMFLPLEVYELAHRVSPLKLVTFALNLLLVVYLVWTKRLFGLRGGKRAYEAQRHAESLLEVERAAAG